MKARTVLAVAIGTLAAATLLVLLAGASPVDAFAALLRGAFGSRAAAGEAAARSTGPLLTARAAVVPLRARGLGLGPRRPVPAGAAAPPAPRQAPEPAALLATVPVDASPIVTPVRFPGFAAGLLTVMVSVEVPPAAIVAGAKLFTTVGAA